MDSIDIFLSRIDQILAETGETDRALSMRVSGKPDLIRTVRTKRHLPGNRNMALLTQGIGVSSDWLMGRSDVRAPASEARIAEVPLPFRSGAVDAELPVLGTALAHLLHFGEDGIYVEQMTVDHGDVIRYIQRPPRLGGAGKAYAVYIEGDSMYPRFKQGELAVVDPVKKAQIGDDVIVQLVGDKDEDGNGRVVCVMVKELVRRSGSFIELRQFNPDIVFRVDAEKVASIHPIMPIGVLLGA